MTEITLTEHEDQLQEERAARQQAVKDKLTSMLNTNQIKRKSQKAKYIEYAFLQGIMHGKEPDAYYTICIMSGRSILD